MYINSSPTLEILLHSLETVCRCGRNLAFRSLAAPAAGETYKLLTTRQHHLAYHC